MREIRFTKQAGKFLLKATKDNPKICQRIYQKIKLLAANPEIPSARKIVNFPCYRVRVSDYRIIYEFTNEILYINLIEKRATIYQQLKKHYSSKD